MIKIEKLCKNVWLTIHIKFCRIGDIVCINNMRDKQLKVISDPFWDESTKDWNLKMEYLT